MLFGHDKPVAIAGGVDDWTNQSDHGPFHAAKIPFVYFGVEDHADYHKPTDTADKINRGFFVDVAETILDAILPLDRGRGKRRETEALPRGRLFETRLRSSMAEQLFDAIKAGHVDEVRGCVARRIPRSLKARDANGASPILVAVYHQKHDVAKALADAARPLDIFEASALGRVDRIKQLLREDPTLASAYRARRVSRRLAWRRSSATSMR